MASKIHDAFHQSEIDGYSNDNFTCICSIEEGTMNLRKDNLYNINAGDAIAFLCGDYIASALARTNSISKGILNVEDQEFTYMIIKMDTST